MKDADRTLFHNLGNAEQAEPVTLPDLTEAERQEWRDLLEQRKQEIKKEKHSPDTAKTDIFGRNRIRNFKDLEKWTAINIEFGKNAQETRIITNGGEEIEGILSVAVELDAEMHIPVATIKILAPKITGK